MQRVALAHMSPVGLASQNSQCWEYHSQLKIASLMSLVRVALCRPHP